MRQNQVKKGSGGLFGITGGVYSPSEWQRRCDSGSQSLKLMVSLHPQSGSREGQMLVFSLLSLCFLAQDSSLCSLTIFSP